MPDQPTGLVAMLFSDVEGSTKSLDRLGPSTYAKALEVHRRVIREAADRHSGYEVDCEGDAFFFAFAYASDALAAAAEAQRGLAAAEWPGDLPLRVRMGVHAGEVLAVPPNYVGIEVHRAARIMSAAHGGQVVVSDAALKLAGADGLDLGEHRLKDLLQPIRLYQLPTGAGHDRFPPLRSLAGLPTNLPIQPNDLVGRRHDLAELTALLRGDEARLVTLVGVGGAGKTRLALQAAADVADRFPAGVFVTFLATLRDPALVPGAIADALGVRQAAAATLEESLVEYLRERELLLVLDNFEQVGPAATLIATLLEECPGLRVLVTSRTRLRLRAEHLYDVPSLADEDAAELLLARIEAGRRRRDVDRQGMEDLRQISRALDGLPLALELAAPLLAIYEPGDLLARMDRRLELLTDGPLDLSERQRTLRAAIEWSWELLSSEARDLLMRSSVFAGGASLEALEAVCGNDMRSLTELIDGSLARVENGRMLLLETIREYAADQLEQSGLGEETRARHGAFFLELATRTNDRRRSGDEDTLAVFGADHDNLRAALAFFEHREPVHMLTLAWSCAWFWGMRGHWQEGRHWLEAGLAQVSQRDERKLRLRALNAVGLLAREMGDLEVAERSFTEALEYGRAEDEPRAICAVLDNLGSVALERGDVSAARTIFSEALAIGRTLDSPLDSALTLGNLVQLALQEQDYATAESLAIEALELANTRFYVSYFERLLGDVALARDDLAGAASRYRSSMLLARELDEATLLTDVLDGIARLALQLGDPDAGAYAQGVNAGFCARREFPLSDPSGQFADTASTLRDLLGAETYAERFSEGAEAEEDEALAFAFSRVIEPAEASAKPS